MARLLVAGSIVFCALLGGTSVRAARSGDMFTDQGLIFTNRPPVPSDQYYAYTSQPDMFRTQAPYVRTNKDMFDFIHPPPNPGIEHEFSARRLPVPYGPLFGGPEGTPPP